LPYDKLGCNTNENKVVSKFGWRIILSVGVMKNTQWQQVLLIENIMKIKFRKRDAFQLLHFILTRQEILGHPPS
jgi:hypothetical protein